MPAETETTHPAPQRICVAIYEHPHGADVRAFVNDDQALVWRAAIAKEWWSNAFEDSPPPEDVIGEEYFERMLERDEFFSMQECEVEIGLCASTDPARSRDP
ncbi:MAG: hypothetical protein WA975_00430 [Mesorhizobium sp.]